jgi:hypothetical protein
MLEFSGQFSDGSTKLFHSLPTLWMSPAKLFREQISQSRTEKIVMAPADTDPGHFICRIIKHDFAKIAARRIPVAAATSFIAALSTANVGPWTIKEVACEQGIENRGVLRVGCQRWHTFS